MRLMGGRGEIGPGGLLFDRGWLGKSFLRTSGLRGSPGWNPGTRPTEPGAWQRLEAWASRGWEGGW